MFDFFKEFLLRASINKVREKMLNPDLAGICVIDELSFRGKELFVVLRLAGLEEQAVEIKCDEISINDDGSAINVAKFSSTMPFINAALEKFLQGRDIPLPEGSARVAALAAKKMLKL